MSESCYSWVRHTQQKTKKRIWLLIQKYGAMLRKKYINKQRVHLYEPCRKFLVFLKSISQMSIQVFQVSKMQSKRFWIRVARYKLP